MDTQPTLSDLTSTDGRTRLRAIYVAGTQANKSAIPQLEKMAAQDNFQELKMAAQAAIQYINGSVALDQVADARSDIAWTQQFLEFLTQSPNFSPQDIEDLAKNVSENAAEIVKAAEIAAQQQAEREASVLEAGGTYEMLWNCKTCFTKGLLGVSNRFCPNCGTAQNPEWRYFPEPGQYKKLVNHIYQGVDVTCPTCNTLNGAASTYCVNCGTNLETGEKAQIIAPDTTGTPHDFAQDRWEVQKAAAESELAQRKQNWAGRNRSKLWAGGIGAAVLAVLGGIFGVFFMRVSEEATIESHQWAAVYQIEEYRTVREGRDCPAPSGARNVDQDTRTRQVPDGRDCQDVCSNQNIDQGDGSFRVEEVCRQECTTRYREETYLYCTYDIDKWVELDEADEAPWAIATGNDTNPTYPDLSSRNVPNCDSTSSVRLGDLCWDDREQELTLVLRRENDKTVTCEFEDMNEWRSWQVGDIVRVNFTVFSRARGRALCDEMEKIE